MSCRASSALLKALLQKRANHHFSIYVDNHNPADSVVYSLAGSSNLSAPLEENNATVLDLFIAARRQTTNLLAELLVHEERLTTSGVGTGEQ